MKRSTRTAPMRTERTAARRLAGLGAGLASLLLLSACGNDGPMDSDDYGNLLASPGGIVLVQEEHPRGWGRPDCFTCHEQRNIHRVNRTGVPDLDLEEINVVIRLLGEESCFQCHGDNGVEG